jgi:hypothetical protein
MYNYGTCSYLGLCGTCSYLGLYGTCSYLGLYGMCSYLGLYGTCSYLGLCKLGIFWKEFFNELKLCIAGAVMRREAAAAAHPFPSMVTSRGLLHACGQTSHTTRVGTTTPWGGQVTRIATPSYVTPAVSRGFHINRSYPGL